MIHAVLSNPTHPEYGQATIPFPIPTEEYDHVLEVLEALGIGDALQRDCRVDELTGEYPILKRLEGTEINLDELDFLAKRLDSFSESEKAQFQGMAAKKGYAAMTDLIDLTYCCHDVTVVQDFRDLKAIGRAHFLTTSRCTTVEEMAKQDFRSIALNLILNKHGSVTPYGVVYDNGMELRHHYDGRYFPAYHHQAFEMEIGVCRADAPEDTLCIAWLYLPAAKGQIERAMQRVGANTYSETRLHLADTELPKEITEALHIEYENLTDLNELCKLTQSMSSTEKAKLGAAVLMAEPEYAYQIKHLAQNLDQFEFIPGIQTPEEYGRYMIQMSGRFEFDENLMAYYDYKGYAEDRMRHESGEFNGLGYISYHGTMSLNKLMMSDPAEQYQMEQGLQMGGIQ